MISDTGTLSLLTNLTAAALAFGVIDSNTGTLSQKKTHARAHTHMLARAHTHMLARARSLSLSHTHTHMHIGGGSRNLLVFDFGGGTLDVTIMQIEANSMNFQV
jgi:hypothetical protein